MPVSVFLPDRLVSLSGEASHSGDLLFYFVGGGSTLPNQENFSAIVRAGL
jgi:hypothetical protein